MLREGFGVRGRVSRQNAAGANSCKEGMEFRFIDLLFTSKCGSELRQGAMASSHLYSSWPDVKSQRQVGEKWRLLRDWLCSPQLEQTFRRLACNGLPLFLRFSREWSFHRCARIRETWRRGNNFRHRNLGFREQRGGRVNEGAYQFGRRHR